MWSRASLKFKLVASFMVVSAFIAIVGGVGYWTLSSVVYHYKEVAEFSFPNVRSLGELRASAYASIRNITLLSTANLSQEQQKQFVALLDKRYEEYAAADHAYRSVPFAPGEEVLYNEMNAGWLKLKEKMDEMRTLAGSKDPDVSAKLEKMTLEDLNDRMSVFLAGIEKLRNFHSEKAKEYVEIATQRAETGGLVSMVIVVAGFVTAVLIGFMFANSLSRRFNLMAEQLLHGANEVASASQQISSASEQLSAAAAEQAASLQETSASVEEIRAMVNKNTENATQSRSASEVSREATESGRKAVDEMIVAVQAISQSNGEIGSRITESNREISEIVKVINEIGSKTKVINDIVFQTKLLSFNASVEAARAGEHGKGFAVVAEEVGNLAQMSGNAAKEISQMLEDSIRQVEGIVQRTQGDLDRLMATGKDKVEIGQSVAERCGKILEEVVEHVAQMNRMATEIASASTEQSQGVQEIGKAMTQLDQVTQQNAAAAHQAASASTELSSQAETLRSLVNDLTAFVQGGGSSAVSRSFRSDVTGSDASAGKKARARSNVVPLKKADSRLSSASNETASFKAAAGSDVSGAPLDSDPRFKDI